MQVKPKFTKVFQMNFKS